MLTSTTTPCLYRCEKEEKRKRESELFVLILELTGRTDGRTDGRMCGWFFRPTRLELPPKMFNRISTFTYSHEQCQAMRGNNKILTALPCSWWRVLYLVVRVVSCRVVCVFCAFIRPFIDETNFHASINLCLSFSFFPLFDPQPRSC